MERAQTVSVRLKTGEVMKLRRWAESRKLTPYQASQLAIREGLKTLGVLEPGEGRPAASTEAVSLLASVLAQLDGLSDQLGRIDRRVAWATHASIAGSLAARQHLKHASPAAFDAAEKEGQAVMEDLGVYTLRERNLG